jgi:hypothetical protein
MHTPNINTFCIVRAMKMFRFLPAWMTVLACSDGSHLPQGEGLVEANLRYKERLSHFASRQLRFKLLTSQGPVARLVTGTSLHDPEIIDFSPFWNRPLGLTTFGCSRRGSVCSFLLWLYTFYGVLIPQQLPMCSPFSNTH